MNQRLDHARVKAVASQAIRVPDGVMLSPPTRERIAPRLDEHFAIVGHGRRRLFTPNDDETLDLNGAEGVEVAKHFGYLAKRPLLLVSCVVGHLDDGLAKHVAVAAGAPTVAPDGYVNGFAYTNEADDDWPGGEIVDYNNLALLDGADLHAAMGFRADPPQLSRDLKHVGGWWRHFPDAQPKQAVRLVGVSPPDDPYELRLAEVRQSRDQMLGIGDWAGRPAGSLVVPVTAADLAALERSSDGLRLGGRQALSPMAFEDDPRTELSLRVPIPRAELRDLPMRYGEVALPDNFVADSAELFQNQFQLRGQRRKERLISRTHRGRLSTVVSPASYPVDQ